MAAVSLRVHPWPISHALPFVKRWHRRNKKVTGALWAVRVVSGAEPVGCAVVARPQARMLDDGATLEVVRVAVIEGNRNACSMLYGACARAARAMGATDLVTYTHLDEHGASLRAAGWVEDHEHTKGGEWSRDGRQRELAVDPNPKRRWWAPWSARLKTAKTTPTRSTSSPAGSVRSRPRALSAPPTGSPP
jgi:hypothetical protein